MATEPGPRHLLDVNLLVALVLTGHVHHGRAHAWFDAGIAWATTPVTESGLVRLVTREAIVGDRVTMDAALGLVRALHALPGHAFLPDDASFVEARISLERLTSPRDVTDLHLVDLAARHGAVLATLDRGIPPLLASEDRRHVLLIP